MTWALMRGMMYRRSRMDIVSMVTARQGVSMGITENRRVYVVGMGSSRAG